jgi:hypothetical protein
MRREWPRREAGVEAGGSHTESERAWCTRRNKYTRVRHRPGGREQLVEGDGSMVARLDEDLIR